MRNLAISTAAGAFARGCDVFNGRRHIGAFGLGMVETLAALGVIATLIALAVPAVRNAHERRRLEGQAAELATDIQVARSEAIARNKVVRISFGSDAGGTCYLLHTGDLGTCSCASEGNGQCLDPTSTRIKNAGFPARLGVNLHANVAAMTFDPISGTTTPAGSIDLTSGDGSAIRQVVNIMGRTRTCSPQGRFTGHKTC